MKKLPIIAAAILALTTTPALAILDDCIEGQDLLFRTVQIDIDPCILDIRSDECDITKPFIA